MLNPKHSFRRATFQFFFCVVLGLAALWFWRFAFRQVGECTSEQRGIMLLRWRPELEPVYEEGLISGVPMLKKSGAVPLAAFELTYSRTPDSSPILEWLGIAHDTSTSKLWFEQSPEAPEPRQFEATARERLEKAESMIRERKHDLLQHDGQALAVRTIFFNRVPGLLLGVPATVLLGLGGRNVFLGSRLRSRARAGQCLNCGYQLAPGALCPECGTPPDRQPAASPLP